MPRRTLQPLWSPSAPTTRDRSSPASGMVRGQPVDALLSSPTPTQAHSRVPNGGRPSRAVCRFPNSPLGAPPSPPGPTWTGIRRRPPFATWWTLDTTASASSGGPSGSRRWATTAAPGGGRSTPAGMRPGPEGRVRLTTRSLRWRPGAPLDRIGKGSAIVCASDLFGARARARREQAGWRIGPDIGIVGFDDSALAELAGISSVAQPSTPVARSSPSVSSMSGSPWPACPGHRRAIIPTLAGRPRQLIPRPARPLTSAASRRSQRPSLNVKPRPPPPHHSSGTS